LRVLLQQMLNQRFGGIKFADRYRMHHYATSGTYGWQPDGKALGKPQTVGFVFARP
jgi:hypothetical protein